MALSEVSPVLIEECRGGDRPSVELLLKEVTPDLYRILFSMLRNHEDTDEVLQETLMRIFRYIGSLKDINRFAPWAMRVAVNQVQTFRVKKNRTRLYEMDQAAEVDDEAVVLCGTPPVNPRKKMMQEQTRKVIDDAMDELPDRQRMATFLFEVEGLSIKEIAASMSCSEGAVKFNIHEGRKKLRRRLMPLVKNLRWGRKLEAQDQGPKDEEDLAESNSSG